MIPSEFDVSPVQRIVIAVIAGFAGAICSAEIARLIAASPEGRSRRADWRSVSSRSAQRNCSLERAPRYSSWTSGSR